MMYYTTPHSTIGKPPAEVFYGRPIRDKLPSIYDGVNHYGLDGEIRDMDLINKTKQKIIGDQKRRAKESELEIGDKVLKKVTVKENKLTPNFASTEYVLIDKSGGRCTIEDERGKQLIRNSTHLKKIVQTSDNNESMTNSDIIENQDDNSMKENEMANNQTLTSSSTSNPSDLTLSNRMDIKELPRPIRSGRIRKLPERYKDYITEDEYLDKEGDVTE